jgi:hypothetical protein
MTTTPPEPHDEPHDDAGPADASFLRLMLLGTVGLVCAVAVVAAIVIGVLALIR